MSKNKTFQFTTEITPETAILLNGRFGQPLSMNLNDGASAMTVMFDTESIIRLQAFLADYLQKDESTGTAPTYEPTGRALAVMDGDTLDIIQVFNTTNVTSLAGAEHESYSSLCDKVRSISGTELPSNATFIFFDTFDGCISRNLIRRIIRACISYQVDFVRTGDFSKCRRMILKDIEDFTTIDISIVSRATRDVLVMSPAGTFTLDSASASLDRPSLFDEGSKQFDGRECSRKEVLSALRSIIESEDKGAPLSDEDISNRLRHMGYDTARRTVAKYRDDLLGIPKQCLRRIKKTR